MAASAFPAGLGLSLLLAAPLYSHTKQRQLKFSIELVMQLTSFIALLTLAFAIAAQMEAGTLIMCLFFVAFGIGLTYYVTINVFPVTFGEDCGTAAAFLDIVGLLSSMAFQGWAGHTLEKGSTWPSIILVLSGLAFVGLACCYTLFLWPALTPHFIMEDQEGKAPSDELAQFIGTQS